MDKLIHCLTPNNHHISVCQVNYWTFSFISTNSWHTQTTVSPHLTLLTDIFPEDCSEDECSGRHSWAESAICDTGRRNYHLRFHWVNKILSSSKTTAGSSKLSSKVWEVSYSCCGDDGSFAMVDINWLQVISVFLKACNRKMPMIIVQNPLRVPMILSRSILLHSLNRMMEHVTTVVVKHT